MPLMRTLLIAHQISYYIMIQALPAPDGDAGLVLDARVAEPVDMRRCRRPVCVLQRLPHRIVMSW